MLSGQSDRRTLAVPGDFLAMPSPTPHECAAAPWLAWLRGCQHEPWAARLAPAALPLARARRTLRRLLRSQMQHAARARAPEGSGDADPWAPVPARVSGLGLRIDALGRKRELRPTRLLHTMRADREAVLRFGVCRGLARLGAPDFAGLMASLTAGAERCAAEVEPSLGAPGGAPGFAHHPKAGMFFEHRLRPALQNLASRHDAAGARFGRWTTLPAYAPSPPSVAVWSRAWSLCTVGVFADWLNSASGGDLDQARALVWRGELPRFRIPHTVAAPDAAPGKSDRPTALPTGHSPVVADLRLRLLLAQLLAFDPARWSQAQPGRRHRLPFALRALGQQDSAHWDREDHVRVARTRYTGLQIEHLYAAVFVERLQTMLEARR